MQPGQSSPKHRYAAPGERSGPPTEEEIRRFIIKCKRVLAGIETKMSKGNQSGGFAAGENPFQWGIEQLTPLLWEGSQLLRKIGSPQNHWQNLYLQPKTVSELRSIMQECQRLDSAYRQKTFEPVVPVSRQEYDLSPDLELALDNEKVSTLELLKDPTLFKKLQALDETHSKEGDQQAPGFMS